MPISVNAIFSPKVAEAIDLALTFITEAGVASAPLLLTKNGCVLALRIPRISEAPLLIGPNLSNVIKKSSSDM